MDVSHRNIKVNKFYDAWQKNRDVDYNIIWTEDIDQATYYFAEQGIEYWSHSFYRGREMTIIKITSYF